ncbi:hypothetical protein H696_02161 [Fonticula alba]|uniref:Large ribosomal subunit protein bL32m n=1 Tax=Fonticula alba TaxID=691883 RepID=A0A058ZAA8_FONAL|nr:hypothetical protein H696_02161 [Fonticula alba]KCV71210.1 hypothetical protein H696_02161 [Fonticula alba]|eukprot:XP_009494333.1 hypothetical protein H696_02161 [Fonticula alba]
MLAILSARTAALAHNTVMTARQTVVHAAGVLRHSLFGEEYPPYGHQLQLAGDFAPAPAAPAGPGLLEALSRPWVLFAVPKKKVSRPMRRNRIVHKQLQKITNVEDCPSCGSPRLLQNLCRNCRTIVTADGQLHPASKLPYIPEIDNAKRQQQ